MNKHWIDHEDGGYFHFHCDEKDTEQSCYNKNIVVCEGCGKTFEIDFGVVTIKEVRASTKK